MRLGTGTFDARPGITFKKYWDMSSFGSQFQTDLPIGRNFDGYSVGNLYRLNFWYSWLLDAEKSFAVTYRVENLWRENFDGFDPDLGANNTVISTARPDMRGGEWLNFGYGATVQLRHGHLLNLEAVHPIYQDVEGIQLEQDWQLYVS